MNELLYITWNVSEGLDLGFFTLHFYSLMWIMAFLVGWLIMTKMFKIDGISKEKLDPLFMYTFIGAIAGARLGEYLFYDPSAFIDRPLEVFLPVHYSPGDCAFSLPFLDFCLLNDYKFVGFMGLASHGATVGIFLSSWLYTRKHLPGKHVFYLLDRLCIPIAIGGAFVRIGNFINSEIIGKPSSAAWAVLFENQSSGYGPVVPRHPAQLYEAGGYILLFILLWYIYTKTNKKQYVGYILGLFFMCLFGIRFVVEFFKEDQGVEWVADAIGLSLNNGQVLSIPFILLGLIILITSKNRRTNSSL